MTPLNAHSNRTVRGARTVINVLCGVAATVLVTHIILVMSGMDSAGGIASYVRHWATEVSLGFNDLLTPADATMRIALNDGLAAVVWLSFAVMVTILVRLLARPRLARID